MPLHCCFIQISQLVPLRGFDIQNLLLLWPPHTFQRKNKKTDVKHFLILCKGWKSRSPLHSPQRLSQRQNLHF